MTLWKSSERVQGVQRQAKGKINIDESLLIVFSLKKNNFTLTHDCDDLLE